MNENQTTIQTQLEQLIANFIESMAIAMPDCNVSINISNVDVKDAEPIINLTGASKRYTCNSLTGATSASYTGMKILDTNYKHFLHLTTKPEEHEKSY